VLVCIGVGVLRAWQQCAFVRHDKRYYNAIMDMIIAAIEVTIATTVSMLSIILLSFLSIALILLINEKTNCKEPKVKKNIAPNVEIASIIATHRAEFSSTAMDFV
jgi:hypothetical protein